jgi:hypothetical protein
MGVKYRAGSNRYQFLTMVDVIDIDDCERHSRFYAFLHRRQRYPAIKACGKKESTTMAVRPAEPTFTELFTPKLVTILREG